VEREMQRAAIKAALSFEAVQTGARAEIAKTSIFPALFRLDTPANRRYIRQTFGRR